MPIRAFNQQFLRFDPWLTPALPRLNVFTEIVDRQHVNVSHRDAQEANHG
jgi:hypothetical protein